MVIIDSAWLRIHSPNLRWTSINHKKNPTLDSEERVRCRRNTFCVLLSRRFMLEHFIIKRGLALFDGLLTFCYCWLCIAPRHSVSLFQFWVHFDWLLRLRSKLIFVRVLPLYSVWKLLLNNSKWNLIWKSWKLRLCTGLRFLLFTSTALHGVSLFQFWFRFDWLVRLGSTLIFESFDTIFRMKTTFDWFKMKFGMKVLKTKTVHWTPFSPLQLALYYFRGHLFLTKKLLMGIARKCPHFFSQSQIKLSFGTKYLDNLSTFYPQISQNKKLKMLNFCIVQGGFYSERTDVFVISPNKRT